MAASSYDDRDYSFGQAMLSLRTAADLTQSSLADLLGVSRQAVVGWEAGGSYPTPRHLKHFIELSVQQGAFPPGREAEEIRALWQSSHQKVLLDEDWLAHLLGKSTASPVDRPGRPARTASPLASASGGPQVDWEDALETPNFYGREAELARLAQWLVEERCHVVSVLGLGGIGKSAFAVRLMQQVAADFEVVIWRSLRDAPPCESLLDDLLHVLAQGPLQVELDSLERRLNLLFEYLRTRRVLLVLDNVETVMEEAEGAGHMLPGYEGYGRLLRRAAETRHTSSVLLTSREKLNDLAPLEGSRTPVRSLRLVSLDAGACELLLAEQDVLGSGAEREQLRAWYGGNPLALKIVAATIADLFAGEVAPFLEQGELIFGSLRDLLAAQVARLSALEESLMLWLAILRDPVSLQELLAVLVEPFPRGQVLEALDALLGRSLIERGDLRGTFTLQSVVLEYTTARLVEAAVSEVAQGRLRHLVDHGLVLASAKEYIRQGQERLILAPILARLRSMYPLSTALEEHLLALLDPLRGTADESQGYAPANVLTLLSMGRGHLTGLDLSHLSLREAYLQGVNMQDTSLAGATLRDAQFTEAFDSLWAFVISRNGRFWTAGDRQGQVRVWENDGQTLHLAWQAHHSVVEAVAISPDERTLATASWEGVVKLWDLERGALIWTSESVDAVQGLAFAPNGRTLACGGGDGCIRVHDVQTGANLQTLASHTGPVNCVAWTPDGRYLASGGFDSQIRLWEIGGQAPDVLQTTPAKTLTGHAGLLTGLTFAPDGQTLASTSWNHTVRLWDVDTGGLLETLPVHARTACLAWSPDGHYLAAGSFDRMLWVWDVRQHSQRTGFYGHAAALRALAFTPDSCNLVTAWEDGKLRVWDVPGGQCIRTIQGYAVTVSDVAWHPDGTQIASVGSDLMVGIWDIAQATPLKLLRGHQMVIWGVAWSPDGRYVASCSEDSTIRVWDAATGASVQVLEDPELAGAAFFGTTWSPDGRRLAAGSYQQGVVIWDLTDGTFQRVGRSDAPARLRRVAWSPDGACLASSSEEGAVVLWDARDWSLLATLGGHRGMVAALAWSPDGTRLASGSWGRGSDQLFVWDVRRRQRLRQLDDPSEFVYGIAWGANGDRLVSAGSDGMLRWWDSRQGGQCLMARPGHRGPISSLRSSPNGQLLASCGDDGAINIWGLESGEHVATLRRDRLYERVDIRGVKGLTEAQRETLIMLGAMDETNNAEKNAIVSGL